MEEVRVESSPAKVPHGQVKCDRLNKRCTTTRMSTIRPNCRERFAPHVFELYTVV
jgi:hypothetical protein